MIGGGQHVAAGRQVGVFLRPVGVGVGHRRIVGAKQRDGEAGSARGGAVTGGVGEALAQRLVIVERLQRGIRRRFSARV